MNPDDMTPEQKRAHDKGDAQLMAESMTTWDKDGNVVSSPETRAEKAMWERAVRGDGKQQLDLAPPTTE